MSGRIRTVKPEWLEDSKMARLSDAERLLSIALLLVADDHGRGRAEPEFIASRAWVYHPQDGLLKAQEGLLRLSEVGFVTLYYVDGQRYFEIRNWTKHQKVNHPSAPRIPGSDQGVTVTYEQAKRPSREPLETSREPQESLLPDLRSPITDQDLLPVRGANAESAPKPPRAKPATSVPADDRITEWCERWSIPVPSSNLEAAKFVDHARTNGRTCKDWSAAWRNWLRNAPQFAARDGRSATSYAPMPQPYGSGSAPVPEGPVEP
jgi:hypothetical protein